MDKHFIDLVKRYLDDSLREEELKVLLDKLRDDKYEDELGQIIGEALKSNSFPGLSDKQRYDEYFNRIIKSAGADKPVTMHDDVPEPVKRRRILPLWSRIAAAACIILLIASGGLILRNQLLNGKKLASSSGDMVQDIAPGGNRALLTLSDGSTIILDSAKNGLLAEQAGTSVIKLNDGQIAYNESGTGKSEILYNTVSTPRGGQYLLVLPDSSRVWLNAESSIRFPVAFSGQYRSVEITGEAYFEVEKNPAVPFIVTCGPMKIEVLGTSFNVRTYAGEPEAKATLLSGSVRIASGTDSIMLVPGQQARVERTGHIALEENVNIDETIAWKNGLFMFNSATLEQIMNDVSRWYDVEVEYKGEKTRQTFTGIISRNSNISKLLNIIEQAGIKFSISDDKIIFESQ